MPRKAAFLTAAFLTAILTLAGCVAEPVIEANEAPTESTPSASDTPAADPVTPPTQDESCDWDAPRLSTGAADIPSGQSGDLATVLIGAWQHTHYNTGAGFEAMSSGVDIRFVFPSTSRLLYCQDVIESIRHAENATDMVLEGNEIVLAAPATGYGVVAWTADTMLWKNHRDGSLYFLQRR